MQKLAKTALHQNCNCPGWANLDRIGRDYMLADLMSWAWRLHEVQVKLLVRGKGVVVAELSSYQTGRGKARAVMAVLCNWADCAGVRIELTPTDQYGADLPRLVAFYKSLGFESDLDPEPWLGIPKSRLFVRYPAPPPAIGRAQVLPCKEVNDAPRR